MRHSRDTGGEGWGPWREMEDNPGKVLRSQRMDVSQYPLRIWGFLKISDFRYRRVSMALFRPWPAQRTPFAGEQAVMI